MSDSRKAASIKTDLRSGCGAPTIVAEPSRLCENACSTASFRGRPLAAKLVLIATSWICVLLILRKLASQDGPIWLAYRPRSPTECEMLADSMNGWSSRSAGISSQTLSSLRQTGTKPACWVAPLTISAKGRGAAGSGRGADAGAAAKGDAPDAAAAGGATSGLAGAVAAGFSEAHPDSNHNTAAPTAA